MREYAHLLAHILFVSYIIIVDKQMHQLSRRHHKHYQLLLMHTDRRSVSDNK